MLVHRALVTCFRGARVAAGYNYGLPFRWCLTRFKLKVVISETSILMTSSPATNLSANCPRGSATGVTVGWLLAERAWEKRSEGLQISHQGGCSILYKACCVFGKGVKAEAFQVADTIANE